MSSNTSGESRPNSEKKKIKRRKKGKSNSVDLESENCDIYKETEPKKNSIKIKTSKKTSSHDEIEKQQTTQKKDDNILRVGSPNKTYSSPSLTPRRSSSSSVNSGRKSKKNKDKPPLGTPFYCKYAPFNENDEDLINTIKDPNVQLDEQLRNRLLDALKRYEEAKSDVSILEDHNNMILEEIKDSKDSIQILEKRTCEAQELYNSLYNEYKYVKDLLGKVENEGLNLVQNVALLDQKILSFQRKVNKNFIIQLIIFLVTLIVHILCSPIYLGTVIYDAVINNHVKNNTQSDSRVYVKESRTFHDFQKFLKSQRKKLTSFLNYFEDLIMNRKRD